MSDGLTLPRGWIRTTLGDVLHIVRGVTYDKLESSKEPGDGRIPILRATNIGEGLDFDDLVYVPPKCVSEEQMLRRGDIVIAASSGSISVVGKAARLTGDWHGAFGAFCMGLRVNPAIDSAYVAYFLGTSEYRRGVSQLAAGSNINNLRRTHIESFSFPLAPVPEQRRIVAKIEELFSDLDAGVVALERVRANLKWYRAAVLKAAVEGRLTEEWRRRHPATEPAVQLLERILAERRVKWEQDQLRRFRESEKEPPRGWKDRYKPPVSHEEIGLPDLPSSWVWTCLGAVAWQVRDGPHHTPKYSPEGIPFITGGHVRPDGIDFSRAKFISPALYKEFSRRCEPAIGDLLYTKGGTTGIAHIVREDRAFSVWVHVAVLKLADSVNRRYLQHTLNSPLCYRQAQKYTHGVGNQDLGLTRMVKIAISLPPLAEQSEIVAEVDRRLSVADAAETQVEHALQRAARLRQAILKRAFEGKLVPQDPTDEPASKLLERIGVRRAVENHSESGSGRTRSRKPSTRQRASPLG